MTIRFKATPAFQSARRKMRQVVTELIEAGRDPAHMSDEDLFPLLTAPLTPEERAAVTAKPEDLDEDALKTNDGVTTTIFDLELPDQLPTKTELEEFLLLSAGHQPLVEFVDVALEPEEYEELIRKATPNPRDPLLAFGFHRYGADKWFDEEVMPRLIVNFRRAVNVKYHGEHE